MNIKSQNKISLPQSFLFQNPHTQQDDVLIKCQNNNDALQFCINQKCKQRFVFTCGIRKCPCQKKHSFCSRGYIDGTLELIKSKISQTDSIKQFIIKQFQVLIDQLSDFRQKLIFQVDQKLKYFYLNQIQRQFLKVVKLQKQPESLDSQKTALLWRTINEQCQKSSIFQQIQYKIEKFRKSQVAQIEKLENLTIRIIKQNQQKPKTLLKYYQESVSKQFLTNSNILTESEDIPNLLKLFPKKLRRAELRYKASQNNFNLSKFIDLYGSIQGMLIICKTSAQKIIGGYTPIPFGSTFDKNQYIADPTLSSFIFSLSQNQRFDLKDCQKAIQRIVAKSYIKFGNYQFAICQQSNIELKSETSCNNTYYNNLKYGKNPESYLKINGNETCKFLTKQWQAWQVKFYEQKNENY